MKHPLFKIGDLLCFHDIQNDRNHYWLVYQIDKKYRTYKLTCVIRKQLASFKWTWVDESFKKV